MTNPLLHAYNQLNLPYPKRIAVLARRYGMTGSEVARLVRVAREDAKYKRLTYLCPEFNVVVTSYSPAYPAGIDYQVTAR